jgi:hypothetical protein
LAGARGYAAGFGETGEIEAAQRVMKTAQVQHEARVAGFAAPNGLGRRGLAAAQQAVQGQNDVGGKARWPMTPSQMADAAASDTGPSPGESAASASAAASSQVAGRVTARGAPSGSTAASTCRIRTPCHRRIVRMAGS